MSEIKRIKLDMTPIPTELINDSELSPSAKLLYIIIVSRSGFFNDKMLSKAMNRCEVSVRKYFKELLNRGWIELYYKRGNNNVIMVHESLKNRKERNNG